MDKSSPELVSRAQLARYAEVSRAAVTNWRKRGPDFPDPADVERELFDLDRVIGWLSSRLIPVNARHPHEPVGTTYANRVRANAESEVLERDQNAPRGAPTDVGDVEKAVFHALDDLRGTCRTEEAALLIGTLIFLRSRSGHQWNLLCERTGKGTVDGTVFATDFDRFLPSFVSDSLRTLGPDAFAAAVSRIDAIDVQSGDRDVMTAAFDYLLSFLEKSGDRRYGGLRTPSSVVRTMVDLLAADEPLDSVYDPHCRTGEFLRAIVRAQSELSPPKAPRVSGIGLSERGLGFARMNMLLHGTDAEFSHSGFPWDHDAGSDSADLVLANPPFNMVSPPLQDEEPKTTFRYGTPPKENANFAWLQHAIERLSPTGRAGVLMANSASRSTNAKEVAIRSGMVEDGAVECVIALPDRLFHETSIPVTLWMLRAPTGRPEDVLFIDASGLGQMASRTQRVLRKEDGELIRRTHRAWRDGKADKAQPDASGISHIATIQEIRDAQYSLHPPSYVTGGARKENPAAQMDTLDSLLRRLRSLESEVPGIDARASRLLREVQRWIP